jgi:hypothetical protein
MGCERYEEPCFAFVILLGLCSLLVEPKGSHKDVGRSASRRPSSKYQDNGYHNSVVRSFIDIKRSTFIRAAVTHSISFPPEVTVSSASPHEEP